jgi:hypothetical protein
MTSSNNNEYKKGMAALFACGYTKAKGVGKVPNSGPIGRVGMFRNLIVSPRIVTTKPKFFNHGQRIEGTTITVQGSLHPKVSHLLIWVTDHGKGFIMKNFSSKLSKRVRIDTLLSITAEPHRHFDEIVLKNPHEVIPYLISAIGYQPDPMKSNIGKLVDGTSVVVRYSKTMRAKYKQEYVQFIAHVPANVDKILIAVMNRGEVYLTDGLGHDDEGPPLKSAKRMNRQLDDMTFVTKF